MDLYWHVWRSMDTILNLSLTTSWKINCLLLLTNWTGQWPGKVQLKCLGFMVQFRSTSLLHTHPVMFPCRLAKKELPSVLSTRSNVFDDDEFDVFNRDRLDMSRIWKGRRWVLWSQVRIQYQLFPLEKKFTLSCPAVHYSKFSLII